jgi:hypothetical protein
MKFKEGDRVAAYGTDANGDPVVVRAEVVSLNADGTLGLRGDTYKDELYDFSCVHPKQCRRLVKRERRRVWCFDDGYENLEGPFVTETPSTPERWIEFVEVRRRR